VAAGGGQGADLGTERTPGVEAAVAGVDVEDDVCGRDAVPDERCGPLLPPGGDDTLVGGGLVLRCERCLVSGVDGEDVEAGSGVVVGVFNELADGP